MRVWDEAEGPGRGAKHLGHWLKWFWDDCNGKDRGHMHFVCDECDSQWEFEPKVDKAGRRKPVQKKRHLRSIS